MCDQGNQGLLLIDQQAAHERIVFERLNRQRENKSASQHKLFPVTLEFTPQDYSVLEEIMTELNAMGFELSVFGKNTFVLNGTPETIDTGSERQVLEQLIESYKYGRDVQGIDLQAKVTRSAARSLAIKTGRVLSVQEMQHLVSDWLKCEEGLYGLDGKPCSWSISHQDILSYMRR